MTALSKSLTMLMCARQFSTPRLISTFEKEYESIVTSLCRDNVIDTFVPDLFELLDNREGFTLCDIVATVHSTGRAEFSILGYNQLSNSTIMEVSSAIMSSLRDDESVMVHVTPQIPSSYEDESYKWRRCNLEEVVSYWFEKVLQKP